MSGLIAPLDSDVGGDVSVHVVVFFTRWINLEPGAPPAALYLSTVTASEEILLGNPVQVRSPAVAVIGVYSRFPPFVPLFFCCSFCP